jgi:nitrite reductase/ring-hydroxylating ferredoxin subunit
MYTETSKLVRAGTLEEIKAKGRLVVHGRHRPILLVHEGGHVFALDNRCPHMGFPLDRGSVEDGILTCHWHHARFELASGCTFDLWADDVPTCPVEIRADGEIWVKPVFGYANPTGHWRQRLEDGLGHNLSLVIAKAVHGQLAAGLLPVDVVRQGAHRLRRAKCVTLHPNQGALNLNRLVSVVRDSNRYLSRRVDLSGKSELFRHRQGACDNPELSRRVTPVVCRR